MSPFKGTHSKSNQLLSALIYSWNSFAFPAGLGHGYASLAIKHLPHWPLQLLGSFATQNTHRVSVAEGVAFAICYVSFFCFHFYSFLVANPRHSSNSPFDTREGERTSLSLNFWATRACLNATEANWQLPHEAHAAVPPAGDVATRRAMNSIKIKANRKTQTKQKLNITKIKSWNHQ